MGHPTLKNLWEVTFTYHLKMKFSTDLGMEEVHDKQVLAQECYAWELRHEVKKVRIIGEAGEVVEHLRHQSWPSRMKRSGMRRHFCRRNPMRPWNW